MSGLTRYLTSTGMDLSSVFMPLRFGTQYPTETGYKLSTGADLNTLFCKKYSNTADKTSLLLSDGQDLSDLFDNFHTTGYTGSLKDAGGTTMRIIYPLDITNVYVGCDNGWSQFNGSTFSALKSLSNSVRGIYAVDPLNVYIGGRFTNAGYAYFAKWNGTTYSSVGSPTLNNTVESISALDPSNVYIGGTFTNGGLIGTRTTLLNTYTNTFTALGSTALNNEVQTLYALDPSNVYIGGKFTNGGTIGSGITRWDAIQFNKLGNSGTLAGGSSATIFAIYALDTSHVYVGGSFTSIDGVSNTNRIAMFNGATFEPLGTGIASDVKTIHALDENHVYIGGLFTSAGGVTNTNFITMWNGSNYTSIGSAQITSNVESLRRITNDKSLLYIGGANSKMILYRT